MEEAYLIGVALGSGVAIGVAAAAFLPPPAAAVVGAAVAAILGWASFGIDVLVAGAVGGVVGGASAAFFVRGARRRGGTPGSTAALVVGAAVFLFALALVPVVGYVEVVALPVLALRARRRAAEKHAGLRTLAK